MQATKHSKRKRQEESRIFILGIAFLAIVLLTIGFFTYRNYPNDKQRMDDEYLSDGTQSQQFAEIDIPQTRSLLFNPQNNAANQVYAGKVYYQGENGKLESRINQTKNEVCEELISYDSKGNAVDKLEISYASDSTKRLKCAVIFKNKISIYETKPSGGDKNEGNVTEYLISPQMKFSLGKTYTKL